MRTLSRYRKINYSYKPAAETGSLKSYWRLDLVKYVFWCVALGLFLRLIQIQIFDSKKYEKLAQEQYIREYTQKAPRGLIYDRNMVTLAINKLQYSLGVDKRAVKNVKELSSKLAFVLKKNVNYLSHKLENESGFVQIERKLGEEEAKIIETMQLPGVKITTDAKRNYLFKSRLAQVLGFIDVDGKGISGI